MAEIETKPSSSNKPEEIVLTDDIKNKIEENRLKALAKKRQKLVTHPYAKEVVQTEKNIIKISGKKLIDSGGGFLIEEDENDIEADLAKNFVEEPFPILFDKPLCIECSNPFECSYLLKTFDYKVCDSCRDDNEKHVLITKTNARAAYMLKDCDLEKREPILKYIVRKNPHNPRWGDMKLYLEVQIKERAMEVWGSEDALNEELEKLEEKRVMTKVKKYKKEMQQLRKMVRSSLYDKTAAASHTHQFGIEEHVEEDTYRHVCKTCNYEETFEKM